MNTIHDITVTELIATFKGALTSIVPWLEKIKIKWKEDAYDDWDRIANSLYENIVCSLLCNMEISKYPIAKYDFHYNTYSNLDFIKINKGDQNFVFVSFQTLYTPFDIVKVAILDNSEKVIGYTTLSHEDLHFSFINKNEKSFVSKSTIRLD